MYNEDMKCSRFECDKEVATGPGTTGKFCSKSCAAKVNNAARAKKRYCLECNNELTKFSQKLYCTNICGSNFRRKEYLESWKNGNENGSNASGELKAMIRNFLLEESGGRCASPDCSVPGGWSVPNPVTGKVILTIDHIDGNWQNNSRENLVVLCYNCHTLTPTFGSLNKGKGVAQRSVGSRRH